MVIAAHNFMSWREGDTMGTAIWTSTDEDVYTHILYLNVPFKQIAAYRKNDPKGSHRPQVSDKHLQAWQDVEMSMMRDMCYARGILFFPVAMATQELDTVAMLIRNLSEHTEEGNSRRAKCQLSEFVLLNEKRLRTVLVMDGDMTLAAEDTETLFWNSAPPLADVAADGGNPVQSLFESKPDLPYNVFLQASLIYERFYDWVYSTESEFKDRCKKAASAVTMYNQMAKLIRVALDNAHVGVIILTSGLQPVWEKILDTHGLLNEVLVIGGGRFTDRVVMCPTLKATLVSHLQDFHGLCVYAFGGSPADVPMLKLADRAVVVVGKKNEKMDTALLQAVDNGLEANQVLLPATTVPSRLDTFKVPLIQLSSLEFHQATHPVIVRRHSNAPLFTRSFHVASKSPALLLISPTLDVQSSGPPLRRAYSNIGWYLAVQHLPTLTGVKQFPIPHNQGYQADGYQLGGERNTLIIALMCRGEAMALGVSEAIPDARFLHAFCPEDISNFHLAGIGQTVLVDSEINSGKTIFEFIQHVRMMNGTVPITVIAGIVQLGAITEGEYAARLAKYDHMSLVALRISDRQHMGNSATRTGNRLYPGTMF